MNGVPCVGKVKSAPRFHLQLAPMLVVAVTVPLVVPYAVEMVLLVAVILGIGADAAIATVVLLGSDTTVLSITLAHLTYTVLLPPIRPDTVVECVVLPVVVNGVPCVGKVKSAPRFHLQLASMSVVVVMVPLVVP